MNNNRYVILNCPTLMGNRLCYSKEIRQCADCTDCVMKQIVEKCKRTLSINKGFDNEFTLGKMTFAEFILKDIDIEEVE